MVRSRCSSFDSIVKNRSERELDIVPPPPLSLSLSLSKIPVALLSLNFDAVHDTINFAEAKGAPHDSVHSDVKMGATMMLHRAMENWF